MSFRWSRSNFLGHFSEYWQIDDSRLSSLYLLDVDTAAGGWGPWSEWTPCSSTCADGTRSRYRFCDSPPPKYGAKFCEVILCSSSINVCESSVVAKCHDVAVERIRVLNLKAP